jgi:hypothetical protein
MSRQAREACRLCIPYGKTGPKRPRSEDGLYAREMGVTKRRVQLLGGAAKLRRLSPEVIGVLLAPHKRGDSRVVHQGGLKARGYVTGVRGVESLRAVA